MDNRFHQGIYEPKNPSKVLNESPIEYKSLLEKRACYYFDHNKKILHWCYEQIRIEYYDEVKQKIRTYFPDYVFEADTRKGSILYMCEIKPKDQVPEEDENGNWIPPVMPTKKTKKTLKNYQFTYEVLLTNFCKFRAARAYCEANNMKFIIITEKELVFNY